MTDDAPKESDITLLKVATADDLRAVDFQEAIASIERADCMALFEAFAQEAHAAERSGDAQKARVFGVLTSICGMHFKPEDRANPFGPMWVADGKRSAIPHDVRGRQCEALRTVISQIRHPGLRARLADVVWCNDRKAHETAQIAIAAYCETITALNSGALKPQFGDLGPLSTDRLNLMQRALQIASATSKQGELPDHVREVATDLYDCMRKDGKCVLLSKLGKLLLQYAAIDAEGLAQDLENVAQAAIDACEPFPLAMKAAWDSAAMAYNQCGRKEDARRCTLCGIDQTLQMREHVSGAAAEAHWVRTAIAELRFVPGTEEQREVLRREMRRLQEKSVDEVGSFEFPLDVGDFQARTIEAFSDLVLPDALAHFAFIARLRPVEELKREALKIAEQSPISAMMNGIVFDAEGKVTAEVPSAASSGPQSEDWYKRAIAQNLQVHRHIIVCGNIEPARQAIASNFSIAERHFLPIVMLSPFVPPTHRYTFALGFARFMQGDLISAAHLIIPQLENSVRYVLHSSSPDSSKIMPDMLQEDRPLSALIDQYRSEMERIFTDRIVFEGLR